MPKKISSVLTIKRQSGKWDMFIHDRPRLVAEIVEKFVRNDPAIVEVELEIEIKNKFQFKTTSQLGYLHAEVWKRCYDWSKSVGNDWTDLQVRNELKMHLNFVVQKESLVDGVKYWDVKSCTDASKEEVAELIDKLILFLGEEVIPVQTPEEWKKSKGIEEFTT